MTWSSAGDDWKVGRVESSCEQDRRCDDDGADQDSQEVWPRGVGLREPSLMTGIDDGENGEGNEAAEELAKDDTIPRCG